VAHAVEVAIVAGVTIVKVSRRRDPAFAGLGADETDRTCCIALEFDGGERLLRRQATNRDGRQNDDRFFHGVPLVRGAAAFACLTTTKRKIYDSVRPSAASMGTR
jgi:hypothetical protein